MEKPSICRLDRQLINQIAAGEVIERPASVVKELVENALDSEGSRISVQLRYGGQSFISVEDDGKGMVSDDLKLCLERHATSKMHHKDLFQISTFGFRGEALAAISSVSRLKVMTRHLSEGQGWSLESAGGIQQDPCPVAWSQGTKVEVRDLFFATPGRLKFLKSKETESGHVYGCLEKFALMHPEVDFFIEDEKRSKKYVASSFQERIGQVLGEDFFQNGKYLEYSIGQYEIYGWIGLPTYHRPHSNSQYFFVNGRSVRDRLIGTYVRQAYGDSIPKGRYPSIVLFLKAPCEDVDVNVHPGKAEVRFRDPRFLARLIVGGLKNEIARYGGSNTLMAQSSLKAFTEEAQEDTKKDGLQIWKSSFEKVDNLVKARSLRVGHEQENVPSWNKSDEGRLDTFYDEAHNSNAGSPNSPDNHGVEKNMDDHRVQPYHKSYDSNLRTIAFDQNTGEVFGVQEETESCGFYERKEEGGHVNMPSVNEKALKISSEEKRFSGTFKEEKLFSLPLGRPLGQICGGYIVAESPEGLVLIDPHAAHERINYEKMKKNLREGAPIASQKLLIPLEIPMSAKHEAILSHHCGKFSILGIDYEVEGGFMKLKAVPEYFSSVNPKDLIDIILESLEKEERWDLELENILEASLGNIACRRSVPISKKLSFEEMGSLIKEMAKTPFGGQCNHGRPTFFVLSVKDINSLFQR